MSWLITFYKGNWANVCRKRARRETIWVADEIVGWLCERGFKLNGVYNGCYDKAGLAVPGDFLFKKT
jgi:hypothetical protein